MKTLGIILAAGSSSRLYPATFSATKQLLPVYDKPLFYYPLTTLLLASIRDIIIIVAPHELRMWNRAWAKTGLDRVINVQFLVQENPTGIPDAFNIANDPKYNHGDWKAEFDKVVLILGDNLFHGASLTSQIQNALAHAHYQAVIFGHKVHDLSRFGVVTLDTHRKKALTIVEKPSIIEDADNSFAIPGIYMFPMDVFERAAELLPSPRGETEITDLIKSYQDNMHVEVLHRGIAWFDTGTAESLLEASQYVHSVQKAQGFLIGSPHEVAMNNDWWDIADAFEYVANNGKGDYMMKLRDLWK